MFKALNIYILLTSDLETVMAARVARVAELEADRAEIEGIRMKEMDMVIGLREEVERTRLQLSQVR